MIKVIFSDKTIYKLREGEKYTLGSSGMSVWKKGKPTSGEARRFFPYSNIKEVREA